jgi:predicted O-methyltransferase YrrM
MEHWDMIRPSFLFFMNEYSRNLETLKGCEIGVDQGKNAVIMLEHCHRLHLDLVDVQPQPYAVGKFCIANGRAEFHQGKSVDVAEKFQNGCFDYVYIDGAHDYMNVLRDLNAWYPKVKKGGIFAGHDFWFDGVKQAVQDFFSTYRERILGVYPQNSKKVSAAEAEACDWWCVKEGR